jgi:pantoate--beta-alanine ligase
VSIFVNPPQFSDAAAAAAYPADTAGDLAKLDAAGCDLVWAPTVDVIYPLGDATAIDLAGPALEWEGRCRPGHFRGVATVVAKLLGLTRPDAAFFGEKDWQQLQVVRRMVADLLLPVEIVSVATVREPDGLAMSSRNGFLSAEERRLAPHFYSVLQRVRTEVRSGAEPEAALARGRADLERAGFGGGYLAAVDRDKLQPTGDPSSARLISAVRLGSIRLLDNLDLANAARKWPPSAAELEFTGRDEPGVRLRKATS